MPKSLPEPAATQEFIRNQFKGSSRVKGREPERKDLLRVDQPMAKKFARENPDADIYDYEHYIKGASPDPTFDKK